MPTCGAVMTGQSRSHSLEVQNAIKLPQEVIAWNMVFEPERVEKLLLRILLAHHGDVLRRCLYGNTAARAQQELFNSIEHFW